MVAQPKSTEHRAFRPEVNRTAAARLLKVQPLQIARIEQWPSVVLVVLKRGYGRARFMSYSQFEADAASLRTSNSRKLPGFVWPVEGTTFAFNVAGSKGDIYVVNLRTQTCECADATYRGIRCKHQIAAAEFSRAQKVAQINAAPQAPEPDYSGIEQGLEGNGETAYTRSLASREQSAEDEQLITEYRADASGTHRRPTCAVPA